MFEQNFRFAPYSICALFFEKKQETIATLLMTSWGTTALFVVFDSFLLSRSLEWLTN